MIKNWCLNGQKNFAGKWSNFPRKQVIINIFVKWNWIFRNISAARIITIYIYFNKVVVRQLVDRLISVSRKKWPFLVFFQSFFRCFWTFFGIFWLNNLKIRPKPRIHELHTPLISQFTRRFFGPIISQNLKNAQIQVAGSIFWTHFTTVDITVCAVNA